MSGRLLEWDAIYAANNLYFDVTLVNGRPNLDVESWGLQISGLVNLHLIHLYTKWILIL